MHIIPATENNADGFSSCTFNLFKQHPHFHQQPRLSFLSAFLQGIQGFSVLFHIGDSEGDWGTGSNPSPECGHDVRGPQGTRGKQGWRRRP